MPNVENRVIELEGVKYLLIGGRTLQTKEEVESRIDRLTKLTETTMPERRAALDGATLLADEQARIDQRLATKSAVKENLVSVLAELQA